VERPAGTLRAQDAIATAGRMSALLK